MAPASPWNYLAYASFVQDLTALSAEDRELALSRFRLLEPHLEGSRELRSLMRPRLLTERSSGG